MHLRKIYRFHNRKRKNAKKLIIFVNFDKFAISRPDIEGLRVNFPQFSDFRGHFCRFWGKKFAIFSKKLASRGTVISMQYVIRFLSKTVKK
jgi:hypothetical protein